LSISEELLCHSVLFYELAGAVEGWKSHSLSPTGPFRSLFLDTFLRTRIACILWFRHFLGKGAFISRDN
jgi:hypothetical protein